MVNLKLAGGGGGSKNIGGGGTFSSPPAPTKFLPPAAPAPAPAPAPRYSPPPSAPAPVYDNGPTYSAPISGGGGGGGIAAPAPAPVISEEDYLAGDSAYQAQIAALQRALQNFTADDTAKRGQYNNDFETTLKNLGYNEGSKAWATNDTNTSAGRAYQNQNNDYAGRGLLQSSLYGTAVDNLMRSLNDQLGGINTAKTNFMSDQARALSGYQNQNTLDTQQARAEALARRAAGMSLA